MESEEKRFVFPSGESAASAVKAVFPELGKKFERRSKTAINSNKNVVSLKIVAEDKSALKSSLGSYSRLIGLCKSVSVLEEVQANDRP